MLLKWNDNALYDVVIKSEHEIKNLENIKIRYLNYCYDIYRKIIEYTLKHPKDLVSLCTV